MGRKVLTFTCLLVLLAGGASGANYNASNEAQLDTALASATSPGDTITVTADITLTTAKTLANAGVTLQSDAGGPWTLAGDGLSVYETTGMITVTANDCTIKDLNIVETGTANRHPIMVEADGFTIQDCDVQSGNPETGTSLGVFVGRLADRDNTTIQSCTFSNNTQHINLQGGNSNITIDGCTFGPVPISPAARAVTTALDFGSTNLNITNCLFEDTKITLAATSGSSTTIEDCVFAGKQPANRDLMSVGGPGTVNVTRCLFYGTAGDAGDPAPSGANVIETQTGFTGTCNVDHCTIVHQDPNTNQAAAIQSFDGGSLNVTNSIIHLQKSGQVGITQIAGTVTSNYNNIYTAPGAVQTTGTVGGGTGIIDSYDLSKPYGDDHTAGNFLIQNGSRPSATASDVAGPIGYSDSFALGNLLLNPSFEDGLVEWINGGIGTIDNTYPIPSAAHDGTHWVGNSCSYAGGIQTPEIRQTIPSAPGATYQLQAWVNTQNSPHDCACYLEWFDGPDPGDGASTTLDQILTNTTGWQLLTGYVASSATSLTLTIRLEYSCDGTGGGGNLDDCSVIMTGLPTGVEAWEIYR